jgi:hypothetical protein
MLKPGLNRRAAEGRHVAIDKNNVGLNADAKNDRWLTPPAVARKLGVDAHRVLGWIRNGKLSAVNVSDGVRPRFRVSPESLDVFLQARTVVPVPPRRPRPRRKLLPNVTKYF